MRTSRLVRAGVVQDELVHVNWGIRRTFVWCHVVTWEPVCCGFDDKSDDKVLTGVTCTVTIGVPIRRSESGSVVAGPGLEPGT
jgi:hypothetical protein